MNNLSTIYGVAGLLLWPLFSWAAISAQTREWAKSEFRPGLYDRLAMVVLGVMMAAVWPAVAVWFFFRVLGVIRRSTY